MTEPFLYLTISLAFTIISAYFGSLAWFSYATYIEKIKSFQITLQKTGMKKSTFVEQFTESTMLKWLTRLVYLFMFITRPSNGVNPIDVSTTAPFLMAETEQPCPN